jgi:hypothetical protein
MIPFVRCLNQANFPNENRLLRQIEEGEAEEFGLWLVFYVKRARRDSNPKPSDP